MRVKIVRKALLLLLLIPGGCNVTNDPAEDKVTISYDEARVKKAAADTARAARDVGTGAANVADSTVRAIKDEVGDIDVDVKVNRTKADEQKAAEPAS